MSSLQNGLNSLIVFAVIPAFADDEHVEFFEQHIRPALIEHCYECHSNARGQV